MKYTNILHFTNVIGYEDETTNFNSYNIYSDTSLQSSDTPDYYLILDTVWSYPLFHWLAECAIYVPFFIELKKQYPNIKMIFKEKAAYHKIVLEYYNISGDDIIYSIENKNNICFLPLPITHLNNPKIHDSYILYANKFLTWLNTDMEFEKTNDILIMPRQILQNSCQNVRKHTCQDIINNIPQAVVFHTDNVTNFYDQIHIVKSSKTIILSDGSAFLLNGLLATDSTIIVLGDIVIDQGNNYKKMQFYIDKIKERNNVIFIPYLHGGFMDSTFLYEDIKMYI